MSDFGFIGLLFFIVILLFLAIVFIIKDQSDLKNKIGALQDEIDDLRNQLLG